MTAPRPDDVTTERLSAVRSAGRGSAPAGDDGSAAPSRRRAGHPLLGLVVLLGVAVLVVWMGGQLFTDGAPTPPRPVAAQPAAATPAPVAPTAAAEPTDGMTAADLAAALKAPHPRDSSRTCTDQHLGCLHLTTTDGVSIYEWADEAAAQRWAGAAPGKVDRAGRFVLQYATYQQRVSTAKVRASYLQKVRELVEG